jgi:hypothetical protein
MPAAGQGGPVRLGVLLTSIAVLGVVGVKTVTGTEGASAGHAGGHGVPGRILAVATRRPIPRAVRRQVALPPAHGAAQIKVAGATYLLGGAHRDPRGHRRPVASVLRRVGNGAGTRVAKLPAAVSGATAAVVGDRLYAIGGRLASGKLSRAVQEYDVATERSVVAARLPKALWRASAVTLDGYVYVLGGMTGDGPTAVILRFDPWRDAVSRAGHLPVRAVGGAAAPARLRRGYLVGAAVPGAGRLNFTLSLRGPLVTGPSGRRPGRSRRRAPRSAGSTEAGPARHRRDPRE